METHSIRIMLFLLVLLTFFVNVYFWFIIDLRMGKATDSY